MKNFPVFAALLLIWGASFSTASAQEGERYDITRIPTVIDGMYVGTDQLRLRADQTSQGRLFYWGTIPGIRTEFAISGIGCNGTSCEGLKLFTIYPLKIRSDVLDELNATKAYVKLSNIPGQSAMIFALEHLAIGGVPDTNLKNVATAFLLNLQGFEGALFAGTSADASDAVEGTIIPASAVIEGTVPVTRASFEAEMESLMDEYYE